uniref:Tc1-like transposase DDE domain-containing protein n=1 Tax=Cyprinus carpio carpio TaxID=630221 RepID=A0A9J7XYE4_CYPCA
MIGYKKSLSEWQGLSEVKMGRGSPIPPMLRRKIFDCYQRSVQKPASLMVWGCMSVLHIWKGSINAERYIQVLEQHMLPSRRRLFQGRPCIFQHDNARPHTASITTSWLRRRRIRVLKWPACSPDLSPIENIRRIIKRKILLLNCF